MLEQQLAKTLLLGAFLTLFPGHADYSSQSFDRYSYEAMQQEAFENDIFIDPDARFTDGSNDWLEDLQLSMRDDTTSPYSDHSYIDNASNQYNNNYPHQEQLRSAKHLPQVRAGLESAINYLNSTNLNLRPARKGFNVNNHDLIETAHALVNWYKPYSPDSLSDQFHLLKLHHSYSAKSKFTGYYTPIISAQLHPDSEYRYPIYRAPMSHLRLSTRAEIASGVLANQGFEIAWTNDPIGLYYLHIQGSGIIQLPNGERKSLKFDGSNDKTYRSLATYMQRQGIINGNPSRQAIKNWMDANPEQMQQVLNSNPRYIYFKMNNNVTITASGIPIVPGHTVAVDTDYIPFGSVLLAEVPIIDSDGKNQGNEWRLLFPQDRGSAIKGPGRLDIYTGIGQSAKQQANALTGYGKAFLLIKKPTLSYDGAVTAALEKPNTPAI